MSYHERTLRLLPQSPTLGSMDEVLECEARLGLALPASVREWFGPLKGAELLGKYSNHDHAVAPPALAVEKIAGRALVKLLVENQACCWWGFELNGSDDPPVSVNLEPSADAGRLVPCAATFSEFVYVRMFDFGWWAESSTGRWSDEDDSRVLMEVREPLQPASLAWLRANFTSEPACAGYPTGIAHRFSSGQARIVIWDSTEQADWILSAPTPRAVAKLARKLERVW